MSSTVAAIDIVSSDDRSSELLCEIIHLVRCLRATEHSEVLGSMLFHSSPKSLGGSIQRLFPGSWTQAAVFTNQWPGQSGLATFHHLPLDFTPEFWQFLLEVINTKTQRLFDVLCLPNVPIQLSTPCKSFSF